MDRVFSEVSQLIRDMFDDYQGPITRRTVASDVPQWDSLGHVQLLVAIERLFSIRFTTAEVRSHANLGELIDLIEKKLAG